MLGNLRINFGYMENEFKILGPWSGVDMRTWKGMERTNESDDLIGTKYCKYRRTKRTF